MVAREMPVLTTLCCPNCKSEDFVFSGIQKGYGYVPDMELWTCTLCHSTFSDRFLDQKAHGEAGRVK